MMTRECPFTYCTFSFDPIHVPAPPASMGGGIAQKMVPDHTIESPYFTGPCPASHMYLPFTGADPLPPETKRILQERYLVYSEELPGIIQRLENRAEWQRHKGLTEEDRRLAQEMRPDRFPIRGPHRMGREPEMGTEYEPDWQIGGREDEESGHISPTPNQPVPTHTRGQNLGRSGMSISELQGRLNGANVAATEAMSVLRQCAETLGEALGPIETARTLLAAALDDSTSPTVGAALSLAVKAEADTREAAAKAEEAIQALAEAHQNATRYIGLLGE